MSRWFTLHEAEELLGSVERWLREAIESRRQVARIDEQLNALTLRINLSGGVEVNLGAVVELKALRERHLGDLKRSLGEIESSGALLKDLDMGLIDFPTLLDGEEVCLCWKLGESHIGFWHRTSEGYAGRKQIDHDFLSRHKGGRPQ